MVRALALGVVLVSAPLAVAAQRPTPEQARALLQNRPDLAARVRDWIGNSGLSPDQIRARLVAAGYPENLLDSYLGVAQAEQTAPQPSAATFQALRALGISGADEAAEPDSVPGEPGAPRTDLPAKPTSLAPAIFGLDVFRRVSSQFQPSTAGPVDASYRLGPGDELVLILTGDVELAHTLDVTREGFIVIPQVGQVYVAGLTLGQLENLLYSKLARVYGGVSRSPNATTRFQVTVAKLRTNQVYVIGEVTKPGSYLVSSAGTVLAALYLAGGPTEKGSFRKIQIRRGSKLVDSLDLYDYLLRGNNSHDVRLENGDVIFVPVRGLQVAITGAITRPAIYELGSAGTLRELVDAAGGFDPTALRRRIQIDRVLPPSERKPGGRDRVVLDIAEDQVTGPEAPPVPLVAGDQVKVFSIADRRRNLVTVRGNVWVEGAVGFRPGMTLSEAIRLAGGPKPDVYLGQVLVSRLNPDSTRTQLRATLKDSTGAVAQELELKEDDDIQVFSRTTFRPVRYVVVTGAVKRPGRVPYREGMTLRDAVLQADGMTEDAWLTEAEIARLPEDRAEGSIATTFRAPLDSSYLFDRGPNGRYQGPPGAPAQASGSPEVALMPYDNALILRQPDWELPRTVAIAGQVRFPGRYVLKTKQDRLVDLVNRAGGLTPAAYPRGAELFRGKAGQRGSELDVVGRLEGQRVDSVMNLTRPADTTRAKSAGRDSVLLEEGLAQRVGLNLPRAIQSPDAIENLILRSGDSVYVPEFDPTVRVIGAVNAPATVVHRPGWALDKYVAAAGGYSRQADKSRSYVIQPGGSLESVKRRFLFPDSKPSPQPGAVVYVPERDPNEKRDWAGLFGSIAQILASTVAIIVVATR
jgi:protein involved in polysaccharide export with SLBB domain